MERENYGPLPGQLYRHFKGMPYQIIAIATHSETRERMVVYQALYGDYGVYVRPYDMFVSEVDHEKYPDVRQKYRFERVERFEVSDKKEVKAATPAGVSDLLMRFLDAESYQDKLRILDECFEKADERTLNSIEASLDIAGVSGSIEERLDFIKYNLRTRIKYESSRLR